MIVKDMLICNLLYYEWKERGCKKYEMSLIPSLFSRPAVGNGCLVISHYGSYMHLYHFLFMIPWVAFHCQDIVSRLRGMLSSGE